MAFAKCPKCGTVGLLIEKAYTRKRDGANVVAHVCHQRKCNYSKIISVVFPDKVKTEQEKQLTFQF